MSGLPWLASPPGTGPNPGPVTSLPNFNLLDHPATSVANAVQSAYVTPPAPLGLSDFGLGATTYSYNTSHFLGELTLTAPPNVTDPGSLGVVDPGGARLGFVGSVNEFSVQLDTVATNITYPGSSSGFFWTQNVVDWNDTGIHFVDDTFNMSGEGPVQIPDGTIYSGCNNNTSGVDELLLVNGIFQCIGATIPVSPQAYPVTLQLYNNASVNIENRDQVAYGYRIVEAGLGEVFTGVTDTVVFNNPGAPATPPTTTPGFSVDGFALTPWGLLRDAELDLAGDIGGDNAVFRSISGTLNLEYSNASSGGWKNVPSAYDFGADTGETSTGIAATWEPNDTEAITQGPSMLYGLWNAPPSVSVASGSLHLQGSITPSYGFVFVRHAAPGAKNMSWLPTNNLGQFNTYLPPLGAPFATRYYVQGFADGSAKTNGTPVTANTTTYALTLPPAPGTLNAPLYAFSNAQAAGLALNVSGSSSVPYLFTNLTPDTNLSFDQPNDYGYPTFVGAMFQGVTNPIHANNVARASEIDLFGGVDDLVTNESRSVVGLFHATQATVRGFVVKFDGAVVVSESVGTTVRDGVIDPGVGVVDIGSTGTVVDGLTLIGFSLGVETFSCRNATYTSINGSWGATGAPEGIVGGSYATNGGTRNSYYDLPGVAGARISSLNFTKNASIGVFLMESTNVSLTNVHVTDSSQGVALLGVNHTSIDASTFEGDGSTLSLYATNWVNVSGIDDAFNTIGVQVADATNSVITRSVFYSNLYDGLTISNGTHVLVYNNSFVLNNGSTFAYRATNVQVQASAGSSFNLSNVGNCWADWHSYTAGALNPYSISSGVADEHPIACPGPGASLVTFRETGLGAIGQRWLLGLAVAGPVLATVASGAANGTVQSSGGASTTPTVTSLAFPVPNGTYTFLVVGPKGERASDPVGSIVVAGANITRLETFSRGATDTLTFVENGLGNGSQWNISLAGSYVRFTDGSSVSFQNLTPATYPFLIGQVTFWEATTLVKVRTAWVPETEWNVTLTRSTKVTIRYAYAIEFFEEGLPPGTTWGVKVGSLKQTTTTSSVTFYLTNGTYRFKVLRVADYDATPTGGRLVVDEGVMWMYITYGRV